MSNVLSPSDLYSLSKMGERGIVSDCVPYVTDGKFMQVL